MNKVTVYIHTLAYILEPLLLQSTLLYSRIDPSSFGIRNPEQLLYYRNRYTPVH
jgi:hypothetical protein